jgi:protein-disulfide isomerase
VIYLSFVIRSGRSTPASRLIESQSPSIKEPVFLKRLKNFLTHPLLTRYGWFYLALLATAAFSFWAGTRYAGSRIVQSQTDTSHLNTNVPGWVDSVRSQSEQKSMGNPDAPVTVVEYMDIECPFCERYAKTVLPQLVRDFVRNGQVHYVIKHFPLPERVHPNAMPGAVAAECAAQQGKFWEFKSLAMANRKHQSAETFRTLARVAEVPNPDQFDRCFEKRQTARTVKTELRKGIDRGVEGTPTVFINGTSISGARAYSRYRKAIQQALDEKSSSG